MSLNEEIVLIDDADTCLRKFDDEDIVMVSDAMSHTMRGTMSGTMSGRRKRNQRFDRAQMSMSGTISRDQILEVTTTPISCPSIKPPRPAQKQALIRKKNGEEQSFLLLNLCYCFFYPYVCRIAPIEDEDIPECASCDKSEYNFNRMSKYWDKAWEQYFPLKATYDEKKKQNPELTEKEPEEPSLIGISVKSLMTPQVVVAIVCFFLSVALGLVQPWLTMQMTQAMMSKYARKEADRMEKDLYDNLYKFTCKEIESHAKELVDPDFNYKCENPNEFPYVWAILIMVAPFLVSFLDAYYSRMMFHFSSNIHATYCALIYSKTMRLNISAQSGVNTGQMLSLMSTDAGLVASAIPMLLSGLGLPAMIIVPLVFCFLKLKLATFVALGIVAVVLPLQIFLGTVFNSYMYEYMVYNDERSKITKETLEGIRVVKYSGLESVFYDKIDVVREAQIGSQFKMSMAMQLVTGMMAFMPTLVSFATFQTFIGIEKITQNGFTLTVQPVLLYLQQITQPLVMLGVIFQNISIISVSVGRIRTYLLLTELVRVPRLEPEDADIAIVLKDASFKWSEPPKVPLTVAQRAAQKSKQSEEKAPLKPRKQGATILMSEMTPKEKINEKQTPTAISEDPRNRSQVTRYLSRMSVRSVAITSGFLDTNPSTSQEEVDMDADVIMLPEMELEEVDEYKAGEPTLKNLTVTMPKGSLTMVIGGVGCGKSSVGYAIIGDLPLVGGELKLRGSVAYCPQVAWINNNTVRGNITFGSEFDVDKYINVVETCALETDFSIFAAGDQTAIGEKGVNLSGGQKARIQLARAVYSDRDIYILDDPLSAVDAHVGRYLFDVCICGALKEKTRILMTNQLQYLDRADNILVIDNGEIVNQGSYRELQRQGLNFSEYIHKKEEEESDDDDINEDSEDDKEKEDGKGKGKEKGGKGRKKEKEMVIKKKISVEDFKGKSNSAGQQIESQEELVKGGVSWSSYVHYLLMLFPWYLIFPFFLVVTITVGVGTFQSYWMGVIGSTVKYGKLDFDQKRWVYFFIGLGAAVFTMCQGVCVAFAVKRGNRLIHKNLLTSVLHCPPSFFDQTPMGRIISRFSTDLRRIDGQLSNALMSVITLWLSMVGQVVVISLNTVWFLAIGLPVVLLFYIIMLVYSRAALALQRLEAISHSPVLSLFGETIGGAGLSTIRAYSLEELWFKRFHEVNDAWSVRFILFEEGKKWVAIVTSFVSMLFTTGLTIAGWYFMEPSDMMVAMSAGMSFTMMGTSIVQQNVDLQSKMISMERVFFYSSKLPQEAQGFSVTPPANWPHEGRITFSDVSFRYRPGLPFVVQDVSFQLKRGEKIGVCGRTGAGKTSLLFALFRLVELDPLLEPLMVDVDTGMPIINTLDEPFNKGHVLIDDIDISTVQINVLRQNISIIPQDPTLFTGTVRFNVDLSKQCTDEQIWEVLNMTQLRDAVDAMPLKLDSEVAEGGANFSCGQRQLLCFARAILNNCRIVIMDEATANVDVETDAKIQDTIHTQFKDKTVIVIAHRLNTIINSDRIMVMSAGRLIELDSPTNLQANPNSAFNGLLKSSGG